MSGYQCEFCNGQHPAAFLQTNLGNGQTVVACHEDLPIVLIGALASTLGVEMGPLYEAIQRHVDREAKRAEQAAAGPATTKSQPGAKTRRARRRLADDSPGDNGQAVEAADPVDDGPGGQADDQGGASEYPRIGEAVT